MSLYLPPMCDERNWTADFLPSLLNFQTIHGKKRLTFSFLLVSPWFFLLLPSVFSSSLWPCLLFSSVSVDYPLSCLPFLPPNPPPHLPHSPRPSCPTLPLYEGAGSGVTNYSERAEKVVWALPSGLPYCIIVSEAAGTQQPVAAGTTAAAPAPAPRLYRLG